MSHTFSTLALSDEYRWRIARHLVFWLFCYVFFALLYSSAWMGPAPDSGRLSLSLIENAIFLPLHIFLSYSIIYFLFPKYLFKGKYYHLAVGTAVMIVITAGLNYLVSTLFITPLRQAYDILPPKGGFVYGFLAGLRGSNTVAGFAAAIKLVKYWYLKNQETEQLEKEKLRSELQLLKSQLHPHFLFNTLNNLYSLVVHQSPRAPDVLLRLSALLRHMISEGNRTEVSLKDEIAQMENYIALERLRFGERLDLSVNVTTDRDYQIAPFVFMPFIENAFKHGAKDLLDRPWITMDLRAKNHELKFTLANGKATPQEANAECGIGLKNVKMRLRMLYPHKHELQVIDSDNFTVSLKLALS